MKTLLSLVLAFSAFGAFAQDSSVVVMPSDTVPAVVDTLPVTDPNVLIEKTREERNRRPDLGAQLNMATRTKDHLLIQIGVDNWANVPDSIRLKGFNRSFNMYFMFDFPFKTNPRLSVGVGAGVSTSNIYFDDMTVDITGRSADRAHFVDVADTTRFKKFKMLTTYLEAPIELRYTSNPSLPKKSFKAALGVKVGTLIGAGTKGKTLLNSGGQTINPFTQKEKAKRYFNSTRLSVMGRVGLGNFSLFGAYQINSFFKEGFGPDVRPYSVGLTISGL